MAKEAMMYSYNKHINGFAALLEEEEASEIAKNPNVVSIFLSKEHKLLTTRSWDFLGLHEKNGRIPEHSAWAQAKFGENIIIANIDSGVWPEHPSFSDEGLNYGPIPSKWRGNGVCQIDGYNGTNKYLCNRKLIGARVFLKNYEAEVEAVDGKHRSARDFVGHGSHTLSTAGGNFVRGAHVEGNGNGTAKGGSPRARLAAYKVCWHKFDTGGCQDADILQAFDHAIHDGVDIISFSVGRPQPYSEALFTDGTSIGSFHAVSNNILVVCSAGNDGPAPLSVTNVAPWAFTVAASTMDRDFLSKISLSNNTTILGASLNKGLPSSSSPKSFHKIIFSVDAKLPHASIDDANLCKPGTIDPKKVKGNILVCLRGDKLTAAKEVEEGKRAGAVYVFVQNDKDSGNLLLPEDDIIPSASTGTISHHINNSTIHVPPSPPHKSPPTKSSPASPLLKPLQGSDGQSTDIYAALGDAKTYLRVKPAPIVAGFSSRGPSAVQKLILSPACFHRLTIDADGKRGMRGVCFN
ncbi:hypothetical protein Fmac_030877 [Flemingia macrophylla]|uniref:Uncharacterized protein n=1 Tax=Flemingia macrophylla TaxID=520843 RepID=A0ABD1L0G3_9FABA